MQLCRKHTALSAEGVGQACTKLVTMKDLKKRTYRTLVRLLHLCEHLGWWYILERNITSSDVEFLEGEDSVKEKKVKTFESLKIKDKPEGSRVDNARHVLATPDLPGLKHKDSDVDMMSDIMSVLDQKTDKELTLSHTARRSPQITHSPLPQSSERMFKLLTLSQSMLKYNKYSVLMFLSSTKKARHGLALNDSDSSLGNNDEIYHENR